MKFLITLFRRKGASTKQAVDQRNCNYVCFSHDSVNTINDLREGD
ncbi:hypothetical protein BRE01_37920 [Brevibacillus reuszeri]|uniref:Uncharacterized protein n=1 Tax=Brevibacillus reuszeri TaxID=54915 RepID=A0ABQ0TQI8_9BACL|nr:hypothetical protein [Brevibacillus reuszeri]MED1860426.1 hypothetical protein [Brevibacillus reuszeri]GED70090.1 hypothetical protein BRE01_37920 [Brevibacillus reuszeri]